MTPIEIYRNAKANAIQLSITQANHLQSNGWRLEQPFESGYKAWVSFGLDSNNMFLYDQSYYLLRNEVGEVRTHDEVKAILLKELSPTHHL